MATEDVNRWCDELTAQADAILDYFKNAPPFNPEAAEEETDTEDDSFFIVEPDYPEKEYQHLISSGLSRDEMARRLAEADYENIQLMATIEKHTKDFAAFEDHLLRISGQFEALHSVIKLSDVRIKINEAISSVSRAMGAYEGKTEYKKQRGKAAIDARHNKPNGARAKQEAIRQIWASGKYSSRDICAEQECAGLGMSFASARKALINQPNKT